MGEIPVPISALYTALQALLAIGLVAPVGMLRGRTNVSLGSGGNPDLEAAIRRHANWTEHVPIALLLIALLELNGGSAGLLHGLGATLLVARILHPLGIDATEMRRPLRGIGAVATMIVTLVAAIALLLTAF
ncbi:MAG: MAPEG family protein [Myxococcota bacterium]